jgi:CHAD domain-containing protein
MASGIGRSEKLGAAFRRLILEDIAAARSGLRDPRLTPEEAVHGARRRLKRIRSILKMLRPALRSRYASYQTEVRAVARSLAGHRDADVLHATATDLRAATRGPGERQFIERVLGSLDEGARSWRKRVAPAPVLLALSELEADAEDLPQPRNGNRLYKKAVIRAYRRGRRSMRRASKSHDAADLHRWRKDTKDLWHLLEIADRRLPRKIARHAARLDTLAEILGLDHDYWITSEHMRSIAAEGFNEETAQLLVGARRKRLQKDALRRGRKLYRRRPKEFRRLIRLR